MKTMLLMAATLSLAWPHPAPAADNTGTSPLAMPDRLDDTPRVPVRERHDKDRKDGGGLDLNTVTTEHGRGVNPDFRLPREGIVADGLGLGSALPAGAGETAGGEAAGGAPPPAGPAATAFPPPMPPMPPPPAPPPMPSMH